MSLIKIENLHKSYGIKDLFKDCSLRVENDDRTGVVGINGTGKSTLLKMIAGYESIDSGDIDKAKDIKIEYLAQMPDFDEDATVIEQVLKGDSPVFQLLRSYETALENAETNPTNDEYQKELLKLSERMTNEHAWETESLVKIILTKLQISDFQKKMAVLSGGQKKRIALASILLSDSDLLILDEPTNHLDSETIQWLEGHLSKRKGALLMVTHDRYFLDRVCNNILEVSHGQCYRYDGNYSKYVEAKAERMALESIAEQKTKNLYRQELAWMRAGVKARGTKQKARIQRFDELKSKEFLKDQDSVEISVGFSRMGSKTIILENISKAYGEHKLIEGFSYTFLPDDRLGIVGPNGAGKSTLLNIIVGQIEADSGSVDRGETIKVGYFSQEAKDMDSSLRCIDYIKETAEYVVTEDNRTISAGQMMEKFLISGDMQYSVIDTLSGGERRRLYLMKVLMEAPNVLILDEPTNDLDIDTLKVLENYLDDYKGIVITVSHDRYFLDRICNIIMGFEQSGIVINRGGYEDYIEYKSNRLDDKVKEVKVAKDKADKSQSDETAPEKLNYKEQQALKTIGSEVEELMNKLETLQSQLENNNSEYTKLQEIAESIEETELALFEKMEYQEKLEKKQADFDAYRQSLRS